MSFLKAQNVKGIIVDINNKPIVGVNVYLLNSKKGTLTNNNGEYNIKSTLNKDTLVASFMGYSTYKRSISFKQKTSYLKITLLEESISLDDITISSKSKGKILKEKAFEIAVLETKGLKNINTNINAVLKSISGVNIRETGGLGSDFTFSLNGLSGKQVKFFIDEIPMDNLGSSLSFNNFPTNLIERIEVYKGVVPIYLGADALGGAVNITTQQRKTNYLDVSYGIGSFNTHTASILGQYYDDGFLMKLASFYNYSDNNYKIDDVKVLDNLGNTVGTVDNIERFHDAYTSSMINFQAGIADKKNIDELLLGGTFSANEKEIQHALDPQKPYGAVVRKENVKQLSLTYKNKQFFDRKLSVKIYGSLSKRASKFIDTVSKIYYWTQAPLNMDENLPSKDRRGETGRYKSLFSLDDKLHLLNFSTNYKLEDIHSLGFNYTKSYINRTGKDPYARGRVSFKDPHIVDKHILGFSYDVKLFENNWKNSFFIKYFNLATKGILVDTFKNESDPEKYNNYSNNYDKIGYGFATTYKISNVFRVKFSSEKTYRLPEGYELFGDGAFLLPNIKLNPEESINHNLGFIVNKKINDKLQFTFDVNSYLRDAKNLIVLEAQAIFSKYLNKSETNIFGIEGSAGVKFKNWDFSLNATKQKIVAKNKKNEDVKIANIPFLFGNAKIGYRFENIFLGTNNLNLSSNIKFVDEYPLRSYVSGNPEDRFMIKSQLSQDFHIAYSFLNHYSISTSVNNIWDSKLYDNFKIQQPGRAFYLKFRYKL